MITVRRGNVVLDVEDYQQEKYMSEGYSVIDAVTGLVLVEAMPAEVPVLQALIREKDVEIMHLKKQLDKALEKKPAVEKQKVQNKKVEK